MKTSNFKKIKEIKKIEVDLKELNLTKSELESELEKIKQEQITFYEEYVKNIIKTKEWINMMGDTNALTVELDYILKRIPVVENEIEEKRKDVYKPSNNEIDEAYKNVYMNLAK